MRSTLALLATSLIFLAGGAALAADPSPPHCSIAASGTPTWTCHWVFNASCGIDTVFVHVIIRDASNNPIPNVTVWVVPQANAGTVWTCACARLAWTNATGAATIDACQFGGYGTSVDICVWGVAPGGTPIMIGCVPMPGPHWYTSPDLNASCDTFPPNSSTTVVDLGIWASCLPPLPYCHQSDYNCNGMIEIVDLGIWASGLGSGC